jgi:hypothetical protein
MGRNNAPRFAAAKSRIFVTVITAVTMVGGVAVLQAQANEVAVTADPVVTPQPTAPTPTVKHKKKKKPAPAVVVATPSHGKSSGSHH